MRQFFYYFFTIKSLTLRQIIYRLYYKATSPRLKFRYYSETCNTSWTWNAPSLKSQRLFENYEVMFLSERGSIKHSDCWNDSQKPKLWLYNLHYFDDLDSKNHTIRADLHFEIINRWIEENPPCYGNGWEPYTISLRLVNWIKWLSQNSPVDDRHMVSICQQAEVLLKRLEYHILGNHLFANAKALIFVGTFLTGDFSKRCLAVGLKILDEELNEQFLDDGGHFELSPMYHSILLWDLLELIHLSDVSKNITLEKRVSIWRDLAEKSLGWLDSMIHNDGEISFFNDSSTCIANKPEDIFNFAKQLNLSWPRFEKPLHQNIPSGYSRVSMESYSLIFDHAQVGPDYLPGHAHADTLSFELSVGEDRVFVNSGTSLYGVSAERLRQRQTAAHNTVEVSGESSSEVWSGFRVARRATAVLEKCTVENDEVVISASHNGYERLRPKTNHERCITAKENNCVIKDTLSKNVEAIFHLHIHPTIEIKRISDKSILLITPAGKKVIVQTSERVDIVPTTYHPRFGVSLPNQKLVVNIVGSELLTELEIED